MALSKGASQVLSELADYVREHGCAIDWLQLIESESAYLMALARLQSEARKEQREAANISREAIEEAAERNGIEVE